MKISVNNIKDVYKSPKCNIETMELKGYTLLDNMFVDNSGFGSEDEPALTASQFEDKLIQLIANQEKDYVYTTITDVGQFQVYVGVFKKTGNSKARKIANNTYRIDYVDREAIRLRDTDILTFESDHVTLDSGGWRTNTTKDRINKYLPNGVRVFQKDFEWFVEDSRDNTIKPFVDGMTIAS